MAGIAAKERAETELDGIELTARESEQRLRRVQRGAEREELLASLEELASWYRDLVVVAVGAEQAVVHADRIDTLREDGTHERAPDAEARRRARARRLADAGGVQSQSGARAGGALRPAEALFSRSFV